jgi:Ca2+-binding EF-hand superfamily protein
MGSYTSIFKGEKVWTEAQINGKVEEVFSKYDNSGKGLDRSTFGQWLQNEATTISKQYKEDELNEAYAEINKDVNGRIQRNNLADYLKKVHS